MFPIVPACSKAFLGPFSRTKGPCREAGSLAGLTDRDNLHVTRPDAHGVADAIAEQRPRERRQMRNRAVRWVGFVFADDPVGLFATVVPGDCHQASKPHL